MPPEASWIDVAIKVLPSAVPSDSIRRGKFREELLPGKIGLFPVRNMRWIELFWKVPDIDAVIDGEDRPKP
jgi:hypothetical protein